MQDFAAMRTNMVENQLRTSAVTGYRLLDAMGQVPREMFVEPGRRSVAYTDIDVPIASTDSTPRMLVRPMVFAKLVQAADIKQDDFLMVVGCGCGYSLAILARLASAVVGVEENPGLAERADELLTELGVENADVVQKPLNAGCASQGPYDVILFDGSAPTIPDVILSQLRDHGRLVYVNGSSPGAEAVLIQRSGEHFGRRILFNATAPELPGFAPEPGFVF